jgi:hypothetical protein
LGVLAGKQGFGAFEKDDFFVVFHFCMAFCLCKLLSGRIFRKIQASQKNRAEKPTVGFMIFGSCAIIAP